MAAHRIQVPAHCVGHSDLILEAMGVTAPSFLSDLRRRAALRVGGGQVPRSQNA